MKDIIYNSRALLPKHIAIIMDGNGRWAKKNKLKVAMGHKSGVITLRNIIRECETLGVGYLSLYAFSTENWKRSSIEVAALMKLINEFFDNDIQELHQKNVKVVIIGDVYGMPEEQKKVLLQGMELTKNNTGMVLNIALNYGGRAELVNATKQIVQAVQEGTLQPENITEETISNFLYTKGCADVDLLIRTSGEMRLSNFLLYQSAYAEFVFPETLWPDFTLEEFYKALYAYLQRDRRFGGRNEE
ncbi:MAG: isoprenyl transferase [Eubacteriales bacterium]|nr:isoprenyl transferase [Eubacteriales bacterium]